MAWVYRGTLLQAKHGGGIFDEVAGDHFRRYPLAVVERPQVFPQPWGHFAIKFVIVSFDAPGRPRSPNAR